MKIIPVQSPSHGYKEILVDDDDYDDLIKFKWQVVKKSHCFYAVRKEMINGRSKTLKMHRVVMNVSDPEILIDHRNSNGIDNRKDNLRKCTRAQNNAHVRKIGNYTSKYAGVAWAKHINKWRAYVTKNGKHFHIGCFHDEIEAAKARDKRIIESGSEFGILNFPA